MQPNRSLPEPSTTEPSKPRPHTVETEYRQAIGDAVAALTRDGREAGAEKLRPIAYSPAPIEKRPSLTIEIRAAVFVRDRFCCRYCGLEAVPEPIMEILGGIYPESFPFHPHWKGGAIHPAVPLLTPEADHLMPGSRGGAWLGTSNLATACAPCNTIKQNYTLDELRWRLLPIPETDWDGLTRYYRSLWEVADRPAALRHKRWMRCFGV